MVEINKVLIICLNFNNNNEVLEYIKHIDKRSIVEEVEIDIVIVENGNTYLSEIDKYIKKARVYYFCPYKNLGYLNGLMYGLEEYKKINNLPKFIIFSNTDIKICEGFFKRMLTEYKTYEGIIAPNIYSPENKKYQNPFMKKQITYLNLKKLLIISSSINLFKLYTILYEFKSKIISSQESNSELIYAAHGSFLIFTREYFEKIKLNYKSFLYGEEIYIANKAKINNMKIYYDKELRIIHTEHSVTNKINYKNKTKLFNQTYKILLEELYGK